MKKVLLSLVVIATTVFVSQAQVSFGAKAGLNLYNFSGSDADGFDSKVGFNVGGLVNIPVSDNFSVQPELIFSTEGAKASEGSVTMNYNMNYLNIPIMLQYNTASGFYAEAGPQIGLLMSAKVKVDSESEDIKDSFKSTNFSLGIGLGYRLANGLGFGARYNLGLGNIVDETDVDVKLGGFPVGVSFKFGGTSKE
ncbi:MAG: PorT family protein [Chitinophagaceae bacterium]|nr:PorT family protein [Chitinophagaceae bacterium]